MNGKDGAWWSISWRLHFWDNANSSKLRFSAGNSSWGINVDLNWSSDLVANTWNHVAIVRNWNNWSMYLNWALDASITSSATLLNTTQGLFIWYNNYHASYLDWYLNNVRISKWIARTTDPNDYLYIADWQTWFNVPTQAYWIKKAGWMLQDPNCELPDVVIWNQTWAGCNSTLGTWVNYVPWDCYTYNSSNTWTWCGGSTTKESNYNSTYWVNNIWWKMYLWNNAGNACWEWYHLPSIEEWVVAMKYYWCTDMTASTRWWFCSWLWWETWTLYTNLNTPLSGYFNNNWVDFNRRWYNVTFWTATEDSWKWVWVRLNYANDTVKNAQWAKEYGFSVRCIKDTPASCKSIKEDNPDAADGIYTIDPDGSWSNPAYDVYCDMTSHWGGWTLVWVKTWWSWVIKPQTLWNSSYTTENISTYWAIPTTWNHIFDTWNKVNMTDVRVKTWTHDDFMQVQTTSSTMQTFFNNNCNSQTVSYTKASWTDHLHICTSTWDWRSWWGDWESVVLGFHKYSEFAHWDYTWNAHSYASFDSKATYITSDSYHYDISWYVQVWVR